MEYKETIQELRQYAALLNDRINTLEEILIASSDRSADRQLLIDFDKLWNQYRMVTNNEDAWCYNQWLKSINNVGEQGD